MRGSQAWGGDCLRAGVAPIWVGEDADVESVWYGEADICFLCKVTGREAQVGPMWYLRHTYIKKYSWYIWNSRLTHFIWQSHLGPAKDVAGPAGET